MGVPHPARESDAARRGCTRFPLVPAYASLLGVLCLLSAAPAAAQGNAVWSATLTVKQHHTDLGCFGNTSGYEARCSVGLDDNDFTVDNVDYLVGELLVFREDRGMGTYRFLSMALNKRIPNAVKALNLCIGTAAFSLASGVIDDEPDIAESGVTRNRVLWSSQSFTIPTWAVGDTVAASLASSCSQTMQSSNADLSGLTASSATNSGGPYAALTLTPSFSAATTGYAATVANARTHAKLTPTVADASATVTVQGTMVSSGSPSGAIALSVGTNALTVRVTAQDSTTKDYTVTITRQAAQSSNADLSGLTASSATSSGGPYTGLTLTPSFSAARRSYAATVANARTHAKLTPTVADASATVTVQGTTVPSGMASGAIALSVGTNAITVRVTAQDSSTKDYSVTITRQAQGAPPAVSLSASPNPVSEGSTVTVTARLSRALSSQVVIPVTLTDDSAEPTDHGTLTSITIASGATTGTGTITTAQDADEADETFTVALGSSLPSGVTAGTPSSVRITIRDDDFSVPTVSLSASPNPVDEGDSVTVTATLSSALSSNVSIPVTLTDDSAEPTDHGTLTSITIASGATTGTGTITTAQDADEADETFTVALGSSLPSGVTAGTPSSLRITIRDDDSPVGGDPPGGPPAAPAVIELPKGPLKLALWTDRVGYRAGQTLRLYRTLDPRRLPDEHAVLLFLERVGSDERRFLAPRSGSDALRKDRVDQFGLPEGSFLVGPLARTERELTWQGPAPSEPGLWQFVLELREGGETGEVRRMWAKFVVGPGRLLNRKRVQRVLEADLTLDGSRVHYLLDRLVVRAGATLRLEPGALVRAWGKRTEIVVEPGGRIEAAGTRQKPILLTCLQQPGERVPGCWAGLRLHGRAPVTGGSESYGGTDPDDSSGVLRHVRIEFAGASPEQDTSAPALALGGVGSGTVLDHVQVRSGGGDGIAFVGGTVGCDYCVASGSGAAGLSWQRGFRGRLRHLYVWQGSGEGDAIDGRHLASGPDREPRSHPELSNVTLATGGTGGRWSRGAGLRLHAGSGLTARRLAVRGFRGGAIVVGPRAGQLLEDGTSGVTDSVEYGNLQALHGWGGKGVEFLPRVPLLRNAGTDPNHDPRTKRLIELKVHGAQPGKADYVGAFGEENWLEEWTAFGLEEDYAP